MSDGIKAYNKSLPTDKKEICDLLAREIDAGLPEAESKIWHAHPVWFLENNPVVGYSVQKPGVRLMFWSGSGFDEPELVPGTGKFKDASIFYNSASQVNSPDIARWLKKSKDIQWHYKNIVKRRGILKRLK